MDPSQTLNKGGRTTAKSSQDTPGVLLAILVSFFYLGPSGPIEPWQDREGYWTPPKAKTQVGEPPQKAA